MRKSILFIMALVLVIGNGACAANRERPKAPAARVGGGFIGCQIPTTFHLVGERIYPNPNTLVSLLGFVIGCAGAKLYYDGCQRMAALNADKCDPIKTGQQLQNDGMKLGVVAALLILHKYIYDYAKSWTHNGG